MNKQETLTSPISLDLREETAWKVENAEIIASQLDYPLTPEFRQHLERFIQECVCGARVTTFLEIIFRKELDSLKKINKEELIELVA